MTQKDKPATPLSVISPRGAESLASQAHQSLEELIVTLQLAPGSVWSEGTLSELTSIGRTPVREAIKRLESDYLIEVVPRHGVMVSRIDLYAQIQVVELRWALERLISVCAARRALPAERVFLLDKARAIEQAGASNDTLTYLRCVFDVNRLIGNRSGNPFASRAITPLHALSRRFYYKYHEELKNLEEVGVLHAARARAVGSGDESATATATDNLMKLIDTYTREIFVRHAGQHHYEKSGSAS
jgi:DNA-binding GntR family transcriptional regulator